MREVLNEALNEALKKIAGVGIVPVVKLDSPDQAVPLGRALIAGGIPVAEITFRTDAAAESIKILTAELPELLVGAGTVISVEQARQAMEAGAKFIVSPGLNHRVVKFCADNNMTITPGVNSPSQIEQAMELGLSVLKFFPAEQSGGLDTLKAFAGPYGNVRYIPTGGVSVKNLAAYLSFDKVLAVGGSWMVKPELVSGGQYGEVTRLCKEALLTAMGFAMHRLETGKSGHIGVTAINMERAVAYFAAQGVKTLPETEKRGADGALTEACLDLEAGGFTLRLTKK